MSRNRLGSSRLTVALKQGQDKDRQDSRDSRSWPVQFCISFKLKCVLVPYLEAWHSGVPSSLPHLPPKVHMQLDIHAQRSPLV